MKKFTHFLIVSYIVAIIFEFLANTIGDGALFQQLNWGLFFFIWYGTIYSLTFLVFRKTKFWYPAVAWIILGPLVEIIVFKRVNFLIDPIIYFIMFLIPFWIYKKYIEK